MNDSFGPASCSAPRRACLMEAKRAMILDRLDQSGQYRRLHPGFDAAFDLLTSTPFDELKPGRHEVMGDSLLLIFDNVAPNGKEPSRLEAHRKYIDVQYIIPGNDAVSQEFGWRPTAACSEVAQPFVKEKDFVLFADK